MRARAARQPAAIADSGPQKASGARPISATSYNSDSDWGQALIVDPGRSPYGPTALDSRYSGASSRRASLGPANAPSASATPRFQHPLKHILRFAARARAALRARLQAG